MVNSLMSLSGIAFDYTALSTVTIGGMRPLATNAVFSHHVPEPQTEKNMFGFLIALGAGFLTPHLEKPLAEPLSQTLKGKIDVAPAEMRLLAFMIALFVGAVVCAALGTGSMFTIVIGGTLGYFGTRIIEMVKGAIDGKPKS